MISTAAKIAVAGGVLLLSAVHAQTAFVHPGCLSTQQDLDRMAAKVAASEQPWKGSWDLLAANPHAQLSYSPNPQTTICAGGVCSSENYMTLAHDCAAAYQCALRYHVSGNTQYADKSVQIMNAWASTLTGFTGDSNAGLRAGLYGWQFACAAELMRDYAGWSSEQFTAFKNMMLNIFYPINSDFLIRHNNTCDSHYWANWDLANMASLIAIGVLCDRQDIFDEAVNYFYSGIGEGAIGNAVHFIHPDGTGQWQESGRDQGHNTLGMSLMGPICEIAWNQGIDLYGYANNRFLAGCEYVTKYNLSNDVPYVIYVNCEYTVQPVISSAGRGNIRPGWEMLYNHYVNRMGMAAAYTQQFAKLVRPEGGGGNYGSTSGGYDSLGFTTLTHTLEPIAAGALPSAPLAYIEGRQVTLSWSGSAYANSYNVKRSAASGGPYSTIAVTKGNSYIDSGLTAGTTYYYIVSANNPDGESANSAEGSATADRQLHGTVIGTDGSWNSAGASRDCVFDGSLKNFFDGPDSVSWAGMDLGPGAAAVITGVRYCPRKNFAGRMVGGKFQGSNTADFSSGVTDLLAISAAPADGVLTFQTISNTNLFRYVRYLSPSGGYGNAAEIQFFGNVSGLSAPAAPTLNSASLFNGFTGHLEWSSPAGATDYYVKRAVASGGPYTIIACGNFTNFNDAGLEADTTYRYVVSALNSMGQSANSNEAVISTQTARPDLVARYEFENNTGDSSGYNYHAASTGASVYAIGKIGQAVELDAVDDYITLPAGAGNYEAITIAAWVYWDGGGQWQRIFDFGNNTNQYLFLTPCSGGNTLRFAIKNGGSEQIAETTQLSTGVWVHVAVTLGQSTARLYVNGTLRAANPNVTIRPIDFSPAVNYIGDSQFGADPLFDGRIDDFRIYNCALTADKIAVLAAGAANHAPVFNSDPINNVLAVESRPYAGQPLAVYASDLDGAATITFSKDAGPDWLTVAADGTLSGVPGDADVGGNVFAVRATDAGSLSDTAAMNIDVANLYSGVRGTQDLLGLASQWLTMDCIDRPACGGADLNGDAGVNLFDLAIQSQTWLLAN
ncbi:MAG: alginate lyase family protein [Planctomycetaceae bacterium]|nr:alginate lyase family protein [Planctomycetaceae bacterium]